MAVLHVCLMTVNFIFLGEENRCQVNEEESLYRVNDIPNYP